MELSFATEDLRGICESRRKAKTRLGVDASQVLEMLLADMDACQSASELESIYGNLAVATGTESWELKLGGVVIIRLVSGHVRTPKQKNGQVDRSKVTRIRIEKIEAA